MFCKDCRWWSERSSMYHRETWHECDNVDDLESERERIRDNEMAMYVTAWDESGLDYGLKTGPMFGCVNFERKD